MFYSHEILTERRYGVATIWLVATLGSKSGLKKVHRKDIMSVNLPKACETVTHPEAPLALRLQSNLLYGISRVYSQQYQYFYNDVSAAHANIRKILTTINPAQLNLMSANTRPEQLVLLDDPTFLPELDITSLGLSLGDNHGFVDEATMLSIGTPSLTQGCGSSLRLIGSSSRHGSVAGSHGVMIPTSDTGGGDYGFLPAMGEDILEENEPRLLDDVDFEFDADGELREIAPQLDKRNTNSGSAGAVTDLRTGARRAANVGPRFDSDDLADQVRREHEEGRDGSLTRSHLVDGDDIFMPLYDDDQMELFPNAQPLPDRSHGSRSLQEDPSSEYIQQHEDAAAPSRKRKPRGSRITIDPKTELKNIDLRAWRDDYLVNMAAARKKAEIGRAARGAKANADKWIFGWGVGGELRNPVLKSLFSGRAIIDSINTAKGDDKRKKRKRTKDGESDSEDRRVRSRSGEGEIGLGTAGDEDGMLPLMMDEGDSLEIGRDAPDLPSDGYRPESSLPWNSFVGRSSRAGSIMSGQGLPSIGGFPTSSVGGRSVFDMGSRRGSRVSASPLLGRGIKPMERLSSLELPTGEDGELNTLGTQLADEDVDFEFFGAGANVDTQNAEGSQWLTRVMERESYNFLAYLKNEFDKINQQNEDGNEEEINSVTFDQLVPPEKNRPIVAAQALHHTLLLATKGLIHVRQEKSFGTIQISLV